MARDLSEATRRMAYRMRGLDPLGRSERRRTEIHRYAQLARYERMAQPEGRVRQAIEVMIATIWAGRHPEEQRPVLTGEVASGQ